MRARPVHDGTSAVATRTHVRTRDTMTEERPTDGPKPTREQTPRAFTPQPAARSVPRHVPNPPLVPKSAVGCGPEIAVVRKRLLRSAVTAVEMLEDAIEALWQLDADRAVGIRARDDRIDEEEVAIEHECLRLLALQHPFASDFRRLTFLLRLNGEVERLADHATSVAKLAAQLAKRGNRPAPAWPTALREIAERLPILCQAMLRALLDENEEAARELLRKDEVIDTLDHRLFEEVVQLATRNPTSVDDAIRIARVGREFERIGDISTNIAEDLVYLTSGEIVRHLRPRPGR